MAVKVDGLTKIYGEQRAVDAITFEAAPGQVVGFLGPNGAGKSTTMKMLTGFVPPSAGSATVCDFDIVKQSMEVRKRVGYLPEHNPLYLDLYVREYLKLVAGVHGIKNKVRDRMEHLIAQTGLSRESKKKIGQLSKGYRQRVGLAQALFHDPEVLILDEPTSGLDPNQLSDIRHLIQELGREKTVILSTHIMQEVQAICDRVIIINRGQIVADDTVEHLTHQLEGQGTIEVEFTAPVDENALHSIPGVLEVATTARAFYRLSVDARTDIREKIFALAVDKNNPILTLHRTHRDLESVFRQLTQNNEVA